MKTTTKAKGEPTKSKCPSCGHRFVLAVCNVTDLILEVDQEPYESGTVEPVIVQGKEIMQIPVTFFATCSVCPFCHKVEYFEVQDV